MENNYRVRTNVSSDTVLKVNLQQDFDFLEILSLKISQEDTYKVDNSNYGVIVGRVLANDAFGIPNAKLSLFVEIDETDREKSEIINQYNFNSVFDKDKNNVRYNLLKDDSSDTCYRVVGTFPNKRLVLDDKTTFEVFDKYYKYTTVTNNSGDYMFYGVPTGNTMMHVDIDLSDCGVLSQKPRDFMYKGYSETQFDNANQFKESTNLDNLSQIITQNQGVYVYPFFGEEGAEDIAITRSDIQIQYKFEPTCVFFGSVVTDSARNAIGATCQPNRNSGKNSELTCGNGTIEMIRKTIDGLTEEFQIEGNQLIDENGVWCYQIPMNLDYVGTDEFGNICATDNPNKGIPTRTRARFRISINETENDAVSRHRAKYLVPNNPILVEKESIPSIDNYQNFEKHYNFGSNTLDEDYRDLFWNKVYSIKSYVPRLQISHRRSTDYYSALRDNNEYQDKNPIPYNKGRFRLPFAYMLLCLIVKLVIRLVEQLNIIISSLSDAFYQLYKIKIFGVRPFNVLGILIFPCIAFGAGLTDSDDSNVAYYPGCWSKGSLKKASCPDEMKGCKKSTETKDLFDVVEQALAQEYHVVHLDFYNDWINGVLYFPLWHWKKSRKKSYLFGLFRKKAKNTYCNCDEDSDRLRIYDTCTLNYNGANNDNGNSWAKASDELKIKRGIIKNVINKNGLNLYYYSCGNILDKKTDKYNTQNKKFARLYSTDIILLGSFNDCDLDGIPKLYENLPSTSAHIPGIASTVKTKVEDKDDTTTENTNEDIGRIDITGMDWLHGASKTTPKYKNGLFFGIDCTEIDTKPKTCINLNRISELGVNFDMHFYEEAKLNGMDISNQYEIFADGIVSKIELDDYETRAMFATLNHNGLNKLRIDPKTSYYTYDFKYLYPVDFDGKFKQQYLSNYKIKDTYDYYDKDYVTFRYGEKIHSYNKDNESTTNNDFFPLYNNSYYFYFGLYEGKTALDMFNKKFNANCFKNSKSPFTIDITTEPSKTCITSDSDYGVIDVILDDIRTPYSYKLKKQDSGDEIISETEMSLNHLVFGVELSGNETYSECSGDNCYTCAETNETFIKDGYFHYFKDYNRKAKEQTLDDETDKYVRVENISYTLEITDANGRTLSENITLEQQSISLKYNTTDFGTKFIPQIESSDTGFTIASDIYDKELQATITLNGVTIDGEDYDITKITYSAFSENFISGTKRTYEVFDLEVKNSDSGRNDTYHVELKIGVKDLLFDEDLRFKDKSDNWHIISDVSMTNNRPFVTKKYKEGEKEILTHTLEIWVPGDYEFIVTQKCQGQLINNSSSSIIQIPNGYLFDALINGVSLNFLNNNNFNMSSDTFAASAMTGWININNENVYSFPNLETNEVIWSEYIDYNTIYDENGKKHCDEETKLQALLYKFDSIFKLSNAVYVSNGNNSFEFTTRGGKDVVKQAFYPNYSDYENPTFDFGSNNGNPSYKQYKKWNCEVNPTNVTCELNTPNIVGFNLKTYHRCQFYKENDRVNIGKWPYQSVYTNLDNKVEKLTTPLFNPLIEDGLKNNKESGTTRCLANYFVAVTKNGGSGCEKYPNNKNAKLILNNKQPLEFFNQEKTPNDNNYYKNYLKDWFKTEFVDRRMSFKAVVVTSSPNINIDAIKPGRFTCQLNGGIAMCYDEENYNIIGDGLEYTYDEISASTDVKTYLTDKKERQKKFFSSTISSNLNTYNINNLWVTHDTSSDTELSGFTFLTSNVEKYSTDYNTYGTNNFKTSRYIDISGLTIENNFDFSTVSCSYDIDPTIVYYEQTSSGDSATTISIPKIEAYTSEGEICEFSVGCNSCCDFSTSNIDEMAENGWYNVLCSPSTKSSVERADYNPKFLRLTLSLRPDANNSSEYDYTTYRPLIIPFTDMDSLSGTVMELKYNGDPTDIYENRYVREKETLTSDIKDICKFRVVSKPDSVYIDDITRKYKYFYDNDSSHKDVLLHNNNEELFSQVILRTDRQDNKGDVKQLYWKKVSDVAYEKNKSWHIIDDNTTYKGFLLLTGREYSYYDNSQNLEKTVKVFNFNDLYTFDDFSISNMNVTLSASTLELTEDTKFSLDLSFDFSGIILSDNVTAVLKMMYGASNAESFVSSSTALFESQITKNDDKYIFTFTCNDLTKDDYDAIVETSSSSLHTHFQVFFTVGGLVYGFSFRIGKLKNGSQTINFTPTI